MRYRYIITACAAALVAFFSVLDAANSPVADAVMNHDKAALRTLLQQKANVNAAQADGATAMHWAVYNNDLEAAELLIGAGADVKTKSREGATPLYLASISGNPAMIERLIEAGADPNEQGPQGETPLMLTSRNGNVAAMKVLLDHKADVNAKEKLRGTTPLMWATEQSHPAAIKVLIEHGADVQIASSPDLRNARNNLANPVTQRLNSVFAANGQGKGKGGQGKGGQGKGGGQAKAALPTGEAAENLATLAAQFNLNLDDLVAQGLDLAALAEQAAAFGFGGRAPADGGGLAPLVFAAREDCLECAKILLDAGANLNQKTLYGWTPVMTATQNRHYKLAAYLLDRGADPNIANNGGWTPIYLATDNRNIESGDYPVRTPDMDHLDFVKLLLDHKANPNARICGAKSTPEKCVGDSTETRTNFTMQWLFEDGSTPFLRAAQSGDVPLMKLLLARGADPKIYSAHNVTPLAVASGIGWVDGVTFEWSPEQTFEAAKMCADLGIDPNVADDEGRTALHGAAHKGRPEIIQLLADHGAKLDAHDLGSRDSINGGMLGATWIPLDWARGLVRVGVQSAIPHPEAEKLLISLMQAKGLPIPAPPTSSICLTKGINGCQ